MELLSALAIAIVGTGVPTAIYVSLVWWLDRYEKEPIWLLAMAFGWGALPAAFLSLVLEMAVDLPIYAVGGESLSAELVSYGLAAPLVEELVKGIALIGLVLLFPHEFDSVLDGIIYGAMVGLGFAMTETAVAYTLPILVESGLSAGLINLLWRSVIFGLNHAFWTSIVGAGIAYAHLQFQVDRRLALVVLAGATAVLLHGLHNLGATLASSFSCLPLGLSLIIDWGGVMAILLVAALVLRRERAWLVIGLADEVLLGTLSQPELELLGSARRRGVVRWRALRRHGWTAFWAIGRYTQSATELAFRKQRLAAAGQQLEAEEIARLRATVTSRRAKALPWLGLSET
jgi:RsiW-degrading membrane proteinase PrsW (M82 family)